MKLSFYRKKLKDTDWGFEFCILLPILVLFAEFTTIFQGKYKSVKLSLPTIFVVDSSNNKCYIEIRLLGFGFSYHFYRTKL